MTTNEERYRAIAERLWNQRDLSGLEELVTPDYVGNDSMAQRQGRDGLRAVLEAFHGAFSALRYEVLETMGDGDRVAARWRVTAKHTGPYHGLAATGRQVTVRGLSIVRFAGGRMAEAHIAYDGASLLRQLGARAL